MSINKVILMGRLTFEPELKATPSGVAVIRFQIACDRNYQAKGKERKADFIDITAWRQTAEFVKRYFHKGTMIAVEGHLQTDLFTDKDGTNRKAVLIVAEQVSFCGSKVESGTTANPAFSQPPPNYASADEPEFEEIVDEDDDLPF